MKKRANWGRTLMTVLAVAGSVIGLASGCSRPQEEEHQPVRTVQVMPSAPDIEPPNAETPSANERVRLDETEAGWDASPMAPVDLTYQNDLAEALEVVEIVPLEPETKSSGDKSISAKQEMRAVWISYLDFNSLLKNKTEAQFLANIQNAFDNVASLGFNTVLVQVRPFGDALYPSSYFPWSYTITGTEGADPGFDPLKMMVEQAHKRGLWIEAWINPYRIRTSGNNEAIAASNPAAAAKRDGSGMVISYNSGLYYNPASSEARTLIVNGVKEIVERYDVDGIHFDDYFYPTTDESFDKAFYASYQKSGGTLSLADWRRENVNQLVKAVYAAIKAVDPSVLFGISPQGNMSNNYNSQFIDVEKWVTETGYLDYICPQIYFGFENESHPFTQTVQSWNQLIRSDNVRLYVGLSPYKLGAEDTWAGKGKNEWIGTRDILSRMVQVCRSQSKYSGFAMFRYDSLFSPASAIQAQINQEKQALQAAIK